MNKFIIASVVCVVASLFIILPLIVYFSRQPTHQSLGNLTNVTVPPIKAYSPIVIEILPNGQIDLVQDQSKVAFSRRQFNKLKLGLKYCFERSPKCSFSRSNKPQCAFIAKISKLDLCLSKSKQILGATVASSITLHREDILQIYEL